MTPRSLLLCVLVLQSFLCNLWCSPLCNNQCCRFVEGFPVRLKKLRENLSHIRDFYEANDDLDTALLDQSVEEYFKTAFACQAMNSILGFYLGTVLPTALADETEDTRNLKRHMQSIQQIFNHLKPDDVTTAFGECLSKVGNGTYVGRSGLFKAPIEISFSFQWREIVPG
uniref:Interleukin family protein n=1 Tax=Sparus aurata TaxID=8175 RepID=A0A671UF27_SPAAU